MPDHSKAAKRRRTAHGAHCKPVNHDNTLADIGPEALLLLRRQGAELVIAEGRTLRTFILTEEHGHVRARPAWHTQLPEPALGIADVAAGVVAAWDAENRAVLALVREGAVRQVLAVSGSFTALAAGGADAIVAVRAPDGSAGRLLRVDMNQHAILCERPLANAAVDLQLEPAGRWLTVTDHAAGTVCTVPRTLESWPTTGGFSTQPASAPAGAILATAPRESCCLPHPCCCPKCAPACGGKPPGDQQIGGQPGGGQQPGVPPTGGPGQGGCRPGTSGTPGNNGGSITGQGGHVGQQGGDGQTPCWLDLLWPIQRLVRTSGYAVAVDAAYRNMAVIQLDPFRVVDERQFGRSGFRYAVDREAPVMMVMHFSTTGSAPPRFEMLHLDAIDDLADPIHWLIPTTLPDDGAIFHGGLQIESLMSGAANSKGPINILILPVIEGAQTYSDPDLSKYTAHLARTLTPHVHDYYAENSFGLLTNISISVFGQDVQPIAGPIQLSRAHVIDYYWPVYVPAKLILTRAAIPGGAQIVLDGRESMQVTVQPDGGLPADTLTVPFAALAFDRQADLFPVEVQFHAGDQLVLAVTTPAGSNLTLTVKFTAKTVNLTDDANLPNELNDIATYLDGAFQAAESAAGLGSRLFAKPVVARVLVPNLGFGRLVITVGSATTMGPKLAVHSATGTASGTDPIGLASAVKGAVDPTSPADLQTYLQLMFALAESAKGFDESTRRVADVTTSFDAGTRTLTTTVPVGDSVGGPAASVSLSNSTDLNDLFNSTSTQPNSATNQNNAEALRDAPQLFQDAWTGAVRRLQSAGKDPKAVLAGWHVAMVVPVEAPVTVLGDPESVQPWEKWNVTPLFRPLDSSGNPFSFRGVESMGTVKDPADDSIQLQAVWTLDFFPNGKPDVAMVCHELGHGIGFRDLYWQTGYREDLAYLGDWAIMCNHWNKPHHCGYHKLQATWITDDRVITVSPTQPDQTTNTEALLVPVELWDNSYPADARTAFGVGNDMPVVQLVRLDLGGDFGVYDLIEARQKGTLFSQNLPQPPAGPPPPPGILITNAIDPFDDNRYSFNDAYRREVQLLNPDNILTNPGDSFDLAEAPALPAVGITVTVLDRKLVRDANIFHIKVNRTNSAFIDLYFSVSDPYYKNPDLYVDWAGDNPSRKPEDHDTRPIGQPTDQGDPIRVPKSGTELHWLVARLRNRGQVHAEQVKLDFKICIPPGGGDNSGNFQTVGSVTLPDVAGGDVPIDGVFEWDIPTGFTKHSCLAVVVGDYRIPKDSDGKALASADVWVVNNRAQKNVDQFIPLQGSPYEPIEFDYSVRNDGKRPEYAYLEPDGLPYGMKLTVTPRGQAVPAKSTVLFHCKLELDDTILDAGCHSDRQFRILTWRRDPESTTRWGGVQYKVMPRKRCSVTLTGWWGSDNIVHLSGKVNPDPGGGVLRLRLAFSGTDAVWVPAPLGAGAAFSWQGPRAGDGIGMNAVSYFEGNMLYGPAESPMLELSPPPPIR